MVKIFPTNFQGFFFSHIFLATKRILHCNPSHPLSHQGLHSQGLSPLTTTFISGKDDSFFVKDDVDKGSCYKIHALSETTDVVIEVPSPPPKRYVVALKKKDLANPNKKIPFNSPSRLHRH